MKKLWIAVFVFFVVVSSSDAQRNFSETKIKTTHVAGNVYMLEGVGGNIGVSIGTDGVLMVDDQFEPLNEKIQAAIDRLSTADVKYVLNTHWHGDHTGGNAPLAQAGATIIAHDNVRERLSTEQFREIFQMTDAPKPKDAWPVITFDDSVTVHFNAERVDVIHLPSGHTDGDSVVYFRESNVVHAGDHFFNGDFPFIDLDSGGTVKGYMKNVQTLINDIPEGAKIIPGHGPLADKEDLKLFVDMLHEATGLVKKAMDEGLSLKKIQEETLPESMVEQWGNGFMNKNQWLKILYTDFSKQ